jgi:hypothetical protein
MPRWVIVLLVCAACSGSDVADNAATTSSLSSNAIVTTSVAQESTTTSTSTSTSPSTSTSGSPSTADSSTTSTTSTSDDGPTTAITAATTCAELYDAALLILLDGFDIFETAVGSLSTEQVNEVEPEELQHVFDQMSALTGWDEYGEQRRRLDCGSAPPEVCDQLTEQLDASTLNEDLIALWRNSLPC